MTKKEIKITKEMLIADLMDQYPKMADVLVEQYEFHCIGCSAASMESLEDGAMVHGMSSAQIKDMIANLNELVNHKD